MCEAEKLGLWAERHILHQGGARIRVNKCAGGLAKQDHCRPFQVVPAPRPFQGAVKEVRPSSSGPVCHPVAKVLLPICNAGSRRGLSSSSPYSEDNQEGVSREGGGPPSHPSLAHMSLVCKSSQPLRVMALA